MGAIVQLAAAGSAFAGVCVLLSPAGGGAGLVAERLRRALTRRLAALFVRVGRAYVVAILLSGEDWSSAARRLAASSRKRPLALDAPSACAALMLAGLAGGLLAGILFWSPTSCAAVLIAERVALHFRRISSEQSRERQASREMPGTLRTLSVALGSGQTLAQAIEYVGDHGEGPVAQGFSEAALRIKCGTPTEDSLDELARELRAPGMEMLVTALVISHRTGSPLRDLLTRSASLVERQEEFRRSLSAKTAQVRLSAKIVCTLPFLMILLLSLISPDFQRGLMTPIGLGCVCGAALIDALAVLVIRRIMRGAL